MKRKNTMKRSIILLVLCFITLGFAYLSTTLYINGRAGVKANTWDIHWDSESIKETSGSVEATTPAEADAAELVISFAAEFELPGDYYEFTVDAVNEGTIDGIIADEASIKKGVYNLDDELLETTPENFIYTVVYADDDEDSTNDVAPAVGDILKAGETKKYKVRVEFDSEVKELPETAESYKFKFEVTYSQYKEPVKTSVITLPEGKTKDNLSVGDEITISDGTITEEFNFVRYNGNNVVLLTKYNLNVGNKAKGEETFLQDSDVIGWRTGGSGIPDYGGVGFSKTAYWANGNSLKSEYGSSYPADVYDPTYNTAPNFAADGYQTEGYSIAYYVEEYKKKLVESGTKVAEARLLTYAEVADSSIGCSYMTGFCPRSGDAAFISSTSYWLGSASDNSHIFDIFSNGSIDAGVVNYYDGFGVRPVIEIAKENI